MNSFQAEWALQHDWAVRIDKLATGEYSVQVKEVLLKVEEGEYQEEILNFENFMELKAWAGY